MNAYPKFPSDQANAKSAFTLVEMLAVATVIMVLVGVTFGIKRGIMNQQARLQAKAELAMLAQALEEFKRTYGDYPIISEDGNPTTGYANAKKLTMALTGYAKQSWEEIPMTGSDQVLNTYKIMEVSDGDAKRFIDPSRFNFTTTEGLRDPTLNDEGDLTSDSSLVDPWRQPYVYIYNKNAAGWDNNGYVLFSKGPDRAADPGSFVTTGIVDETSENNIDNIYPNQ